MCNCGRKRATLFTPTETIASHSAHIPHAATRLTIRYEYIGSTGLTVFGGATRARYRFTGPGAQVAVDARDGTSLDRVPTLKRVSVRVTI
jgi:hypothetical protein